MSSDSGDRTQEIPHDWDVLAGAGEKTAPLPEMAESIPEPSLQRAPLPKINLVASYWADGVTVLAIITATLLGLSAAGHQLVATAVPWAAVLGAAWWLFAASVLVTIRQGTPGMLLAGIQFEQRIATSRVVAVIGAAVFGVVLLGLPGLLGTARSPLALAAGRPLEAVPVDGEGGA